MENIDSISTAAIPINSNTTNTSRNSITELIDKTEEVSERNKKQNKNKIQNTSNELDLSVTFNTIVTSSIRLMSVNDEFYYLVIFLIVWLALILFEFLYGFLENKVDIVSDSFFNYFKTLAFLISGLSILFSRVYVFNSIFLKNRIELIAAISNCVFLTMVSLHMCIQSLHLLTEKDEHSEHDDNATINFIDSFNIVKIIINLIALLRFSDYLIHPSIQIKILLWKKYKEWKNIEKYTIDELKDAKVLIKQWNNHFENMNVLTMNLFADMISSLLFILCLYIFRNKHYEYVYALVSMINMILIFVLIAPACSSILNILMQGRSSICDSYAKKLDREISYFEGCSGIKDIKLWMVSQNEIKCSNS
jgi:Co/Zn/Cd efflux system component